MVHLADFLGAPSGASETVTPMRFATVLRLKADGTREAARLRWGLVPSWATDPNRSPLIHARAESLGERPAFREAFAGRRGLLVVQTFNEGKEITPNKTEQHTITPDDGRPLAIAVVWDRWQDPLGRGPPLESFAMVTVPANSLIATITDRMPAVLAPEHWSAWLGEEPSDAHALKAMLKPFEGRWTMRPEKPQKPTRPRSEDLQPRLL